MLKLVKPFCPLSRNVGEMMQPLCQRRPLPDIHCPLLPIVQKGKAPLHSAQ